MDVREKLVELLKKFVPTVWYEDCDEIRHEKCDEIHCSECIADRLIANGVTVQENLVAKQVVIDKKYGSARCPSCNAVLGASSHYCWQCGQKVTHKLPQPPKGE